MNNAVHKQNRFKGLKTKQHATFNRIWIHAIWATKERIPLISTGIEKKVHKFISDQLREQGCPERIINGMPDHIHFFFY